MSLLGELDTFADELDGERWHNAAKACRDAATEIERLERLIGKSAKLRAEVEEWKDETNYYAAEARKLRVALERIANNDADRWPGQHARAALNEEKP